MNVKSPRATCAPDVGDLAMVTILGTLATWRVSHLLSSEDGPAQIVARVRGRLGSGEFGQLMDCFQCLSVWAALPIAASVGGRRRDRILIWLAISGAACLVERSSDAVSALPEIIYTTQTGGTDDVLRTAPSTGRSAHSPDPGCDTARGSPTRDVAISRASPDSGARFDHGADLLILGHRHGAGGRSTRRRGTATHRAISAR